MFRALINFFLKIWSLMRILKKLRGLIQIFKIFEKINENLKKKLRSLIKNFITFVRLD